MLRADVLVGHVSLHRQIVVPDPVCGLGLMGPGRWAEARPATPFPTTGIAFVVWLQAAGLFVSGALACMPASAVQLHCELFTALTTSG